MRGVVSASLEPTIRLRIIGRDGRQAVVSAVINTGFSGDLILPFETIEFLNLPFVIGAEFMLGDGSIVAMPAYDAMVEWHDRTRRVDVYGSDGGPLIGMSLLRASHIELDAVPDGQVSVVPIP